MFRYQNRSHGIWLLAMAFGVSACVDGEDIAPETTTPSTGTWSVQPATADLNDFFDCLEEAGVTLISAHRGGTPENSVIGMQETLTEVPAIMEVDVATSRDGVLFLMHDDTLGRTTSGSGEVRETDWADIRDLHLKDGATLLRGSSPPTLGEALEWAEGKTILQIDFKRSTRYEDVIDLVKRMKATSRVIYIAYTYGQAKKLHRLHPEAMISLTIDEPSDLPEALDLGIPSDRIIAWTGNTAPNETVFRMLNDRDIEVIFGTLGGQDSIDNRIAATGDEARYGRIARQGVDIIATDRPIEAYAALEAAGLTGSSGMCGLID